MAHRNRCFTWAYLLKMGGSFHGYSNEMGWTTHQKNHPVGPWDWYPSCPPFTGLFTSCWTSLKNVGKTTLIYQKIPAIWIHLVHQKNTYLWWLRWLGENHENPRPPAAQAMNKAKHQGHGKEGRPRQGQPTWDENGFSLYEVYSLHDLKCDIQLEM